MTEKHRVVDLFAGAGGLSYGFEQVGFDIELAIEKDAWAVETYILNHKNKNAVEADICNLEDSFFKLYKGKIDVVMGGPPCQGFSIAASNRRKQDDNRNVLYQQFLRAVTLIQPKVVLIENVKEIVNYKLPDETKIVQDILSVLHKQGYICDFTILNCRNYGIPQDRKRFFLVAVKDTICSSNFKLEALMERFITKEISFGEAISDLPKVKPKEFPENSVMEYACEPKNDYQRLMRQGSSVVSNHIPMQHTDRTIQKFDILIKGDVDKQELPEELLPRVRSHVETISTVSYGQNHRIINSNKVSPTITASFYSSFIHPYQPRNITVREAARIQSFPDAFVFRGKKTTLSKKLLARKGIVEELHLDQFNQVGNAVPPIMAKHLAEICAAFLQGGTYL